MKSTKQTWEINAPLDEVWRALVDPKTIDQWGGGPAKMSAKEGVEFSLWGGDIHGTNTKVVKNKLLKQDWFSGDWERPSKLSFSFTARGDKTEVKLVQSDIPDSELRDIDQGWKDYYLRPIKELLEK